MMTPQQSASILSRMFGYNGPADQRSVDQFLAANPAAAARMGKYRETMKQMAGGQSLSGFQEGGLLGKLKEGWSDFEDMLNRAVGNPDYVDPEGIYYKNDLSLPVMPPVDELPGLRPTDPRDVSPAPMPTDPRSGGPELPATPEQGLQQLQEGQQQLALQAGQPLQTATVAQMGTTPGLMTPGVGQVTADRTATIQPITDTREATAPTPTPASLIEAATAAPQVTEAVEGLEPAKGEVSEVIEAQEFDPQKLAQLGLTAPQIEEARKIADIPDLELTNEQLVEAATLASTGMSLPQAVAQTTNQDFQTVAAKFEGQAPRAEAETEFDLGEATAAQGTVSAEELVGAAGVGVPAEQAQNIQAEYSNNLESAKGQVEAGELITADTAYNLPPTQSAVLNQTVVQGAAKAGTFPTAEAAQSSFQQTLQSAQGNVGANELVNAKDITKAAEAVEATAATLEALDQAAIAQAQSGTLSQAAFAQAQQGVVSPNATVSGQLTKLMEQFNNGTPSWAAGAMRAANAAMAARGLGASSMAGAAIVQAAMESATPIAAQDAQMFMQMDMANLDKRQQVALANAAAQQNIEMTNLGFAQQAALQNSTNAFALQAQNLSNQQAVVLANAQMKAALQGQVLGINTQAAVANAARYAESNNINLNNEQQVLLQRSAQALQVDMANLSNTQQTALANLQVQAALTGQQLTNEQQVAMLTSTQTFEAAQFTANAQQQAFLQDAAARLALEGKVMDITQQTAMFNASRVASVNDINLTNEQQVLLQRSAENLQVDLANLSAGQQTALANAQLRASLQGKVLDNQQQAAILNAQRFAEVNNLNLTNQQQVLVQEYVSRTALEGKALDNRQQTAIFNVSAQLREREIDLTNEQQTRLFNTTNALNIEVQNLSNRQQTALANAQIEAAIRGQELSNTQQQNVVNAARIGEIANINFTAEQQKAVENARLAQTVDIENLNAAQAKVLSDAAAMSSVDMTNLNFRQQAEVQNAQNFLQLDLANLTNEQQTELFKTQQIVQGLFSDQAAQNAAAQFNASSENQTEQFFQSLVTQVNQFNTSQVNAMRQFNSGQTNALAQFNAELDTRRDLFNAQNALIIEQANAQWRQNVTTLNTAAQNEANMDFAKTLNALSSATLANVWQRERDNMNFAFTAEQSGIDRQLSILLADKQLEEIRAQLKDKDDTYKAAFITDLLFGSSSSGSRSGNLLDLFTGD